MQSLLPKDTLLRTYDLPTLQETRSVHDFMNRPKIEFIFQNNALLLHSYFVVISKSEKNGESNIFRGGGGGGGGAS